MNNQINVNVVSAQENKEEMNMETINIVEQKEQVNIGDPMPSKKEESAWRIWIQRYLKSQVELLKQLNNCKTQEEFNAILHKKAGSIINGTMKKVDAIKDDPTFAEDAEQLQQDSNILHGTIENAAKKGTSVLKAILDWLVDLILQILMLVFKVACRIIACILRGVIKTGGFIVEEFLEVKERYEEATAEVADNATSV